MPMHCGAVQENLLESEFFGVILHYPGQHIPTGKKGLFEEADGGTLFPDKIGEMGPAMQASYCGYCRTARSSAWAIRNTARSP